MVKDESVDPEVLAALLDGGLSPAERDEAFARLSRSQGDYETLVEAMRILRDLEADAGAPGDTSLRLTTAQAGAGVAKHPDVQPERIAAPVEQPDEPQREIDQPHLHREGSPPAPEPDIRPYRRLPSAKVLLPLAAVLAGALLVPRLIRQNDAPRSPLGLLDGATLVARPGNGSLTDALGSGWEDPGWSRPRSGSSTLPDERREFRIGVRLVDMDVALDSRDAAAMELVAPELISLIGQIPGGALVMAEYGEVARRAGRDPGHTPQSERARAHLADLLRGSSSFELGIWAEQARLAARAEQTAFFSGSAVRTLDDLTPRIAREQGDDAEVVRRLRAVRRLVDHGVSPQQLVPIRRELVVLFREGG